MTTTGDHPRINKQNCCFPNLYPVCNLIDTFQSTGFHFSSISLEIVLFCDCTASIELSSNRIKTAEKPQQTFSQPTWRCNSTCRKESFFSPLEFWPWGPLDMGFNRIEKKSIDSHHAL
jgi:hypothetical protein